MSVLVYIAPRPNPFWTFTDLDMSQDEGQGSSSSSLPEYILPHQVPSSSQIFPSFSQSQRLERLSESGDAASTPATVPSSTSTSPANGKDAFPCQFCGRGFLFKNNLKAHLRTHTRDKKYECEICTKSFIYKESLKNHMLLHSNELPYHCEICGKKFRDRSNRRKHVKNVHKFQPESQKSARGKKKPVAGAEVTQTTNGGSEAIPTPGPSKRGRKRGSKDLSSQTVTTASETATNVPPSYLSRHQYSSSASTSPTLSSTTIKSEPLDVWEPSIPFQQQYLAQGEGGLAMYNPNPPAYPGSTSYLSYQQSRDEIGQNQPQFWGSGTAAAGGDYGHSYGSIPPTTTASPLPLQFASMSMHSPLGGHYSSGAAQPSSSGQYGHSHGQTYAQTGQSSHLGGEIPAQANPPPNHGGNHNHTNVYKDLSHFDFSYL